jgi:multicomponent Na+:H+ antiporter subunit D
VALMMLLGGGTSFEAVRSALAAESQFGIARIAIAAFLCGLLIKSGMVPFHGWLPAAYSAAPAPTSIFLAGIATKATGVYALIRLVTDVFPPSAALGQVLMLVGAVSIVVGALAAIGQKDMKRLLAYSSISQIGYIVLGLGCGAMPDAKPVIASLSLATLGAIFHLFNHAIFKSLLFVNSASIEQQLGTTELARMGGLGKNMPVTGWTNVLAILSTAGIPPLSGFWSKLLIIIALWQAGFQTYAFIAVGFSVVTLAYLLLIQRRAFFGKLPEELSEVSEASGGLVFASVFLAALTTAIGVLMFPLFNSLQSLR